LHSALIFANGETADGPMVRQALAWAGDALLIAADGGARVAQHYGLRVDVVIGDMDSLSPDELETLRAQGSAVRQYPEEKNETDLELALHYAADQGAGRVRILGGVGGRLDQTLGNIYLLALPILTDRDVRLVADAQETWLLRPGHNVIAGAPGDTVSLIPISGTVEGVRTANLYYPLREETLAFGPARGLSNVMQTDEAHVWVGAGRLLVVHTIGRA
jgi:thiamine pyrophosphokinase